MAMVNVATSRLGFVEPASTSTAAAALGLPAAVVPIIGPIILGITIAIQRILNRPKPQQKVATTAIVNEIEPLLEQNRDAYLAGPRTVSSRQQALINYDRGWQWVVENCGSQDDRYGEPGSWCIEDRLCNGCHVSYGARSWTGNGKFPWATWYRDPIENDTPVPDPEAPLAGGNYAVGVDPLTGNPIIRHGDPSQSSLFLPVILGLAGYLMFKFMRQE